jgi:hypothetical protein
MAHDGAAIALPRACVPDREERPAAVDRAAAPNGAYQRA